VTERWSAEVAAHRLQFDGAQQAAAARLDILSDALRAGEPTLFTRLRASVPWLADESRTPPRGVYLWGGVGRGKTLLMDLFFASVSERASMSARHDSPRTAERSHFYHFMRDVHEALGEIKQHADPLDLVAQRLSERTRVICLDEFFVADIADAMILAGLFDGLFRRGVTLVATSNVPPQDLYKDGLQRQRFLPAIELIRTNVEVKHLDGGIDYRLRQLERAPTYMDSRSTGTQAALQERFAALTGAVAEAGAIKESTLTIEGRELRAVMWSPGTAWFEFTELCEGPRSQNDYIELAHLFHTIFISNIPTFGPEDEDAARRFIMLIDELYDRGVKTVVSAVAAPPALYHGERLKLEFERAASRLIEMQTQLYLAGQHRP
jgi:cell division protein ZapE